MEIYRSELSQKFIYLFTKTMGLNDNEFEIFIGHFHREYVPKKSFYLKEGQVTKQKAYLNKGCSRSFVMDEKGGEHILFFAFEDWWLGDIESYHTQLPGRQHVQALEDCELLCISKTDFDRLQKEIPSLNMWDHVKQQKALFAMMNRLNEVKTLTAEQRYMNLLEKHPQIFQRVPLQYIALYLDIEPQSLSRMRKRIISK